MRCVHRTCGLRRKIVFSLAVGGMGLAIEERHATHFRRIAFVAVELRPTSRIPTPISDSALEVGPTEIVPSA
jgi:hypothetical protein